MTTPAESLRILMDTQRGVIRSAQNSAVYNQQEGLQQIYPDSKLKFYSQGEREQWERADYHIRGGVTEALQVVGVPRYSVAMHESPRNMLNGLRRIRYTVNLGDAPMIHADDEDYAEQTLHWEKSHQIGMLYHPGRWPFRETIEVKSTPLVVLDRLFLKTSWDVREVMAEIKKLNPGANDRLINAQIYTHNVSHGNVKDLVTLALLNPSLSLEHNPLAVIPTP